MTVYDISEQLFLNFYNSNRLRFHRTFELQLFYNSLVPLFAHVPLTTRIITYIYFEILYLLWIIFIICSPFSISNGLFPFLLASFSYPPYSFATRSFDPDTVTCSPAILVITILFFTHVCVRFFLGSFFLPTRFHKYIFFVFYVLSFRFLHSWLERRGIKPWRIYPLGDFATSEEW